MNHVRVNATIRAMRSAISLSADSSYPTPILANAMFTCAVTARTDRHRSRGPGQRDDRVMTSSTRPPGRGETIP